MILNEVSDLAKCSTARSIARPLYDRQLTLFTPEFHASVLVKHLALFTTTAASELRFVCAAAVCTCITDVSVSSNKKLSCRREAARCFVAVSS